jgi:hypothetical protein
MNTAIWKFEIRPDAVCGESYPIQVSMPIGARPLCCREVDGRAYVWAEVDLNAASHKVTLYSVGTGWGTIPDRCRYLGTVFYSSGIFHIYTELESGK